MTDPSNASTQALREDINRLWERYQNSNLDADSVTDTELNQVDETLDRLETGSLRASEKTGSKVTSWKTNSFVKRAILLAFGLSKITEYEHGGVTYHDVLPLRDTQDFQSKGTRNTPTGTVVRRGSYVGNDCILMSPSFVNIGSHVGDLSLVDSCVTIGSCSQIGTNVKVGANVTIGGVLEPVEDSPVIIEDEVSIGAGCRVTSGFRIGKNTVVGENTLLTPNIPIYDLVEDEVIHGHLPADRRAFTRFVESSLGKHDLFDGEAYKPAVVATELDADTLEATEKEDTLRD